MKGAQVLGASLVLLLVGSCYKEPIGSWPGEFTWSIATPAGQGFDAAILDSAFIQAGQLEFVDGLLVIRNGCIVAEEYYNGYTDSTPHDIRSVSKSFLSAMTGIALRERVLKSIDQKVLDFFPEYVYQGIDERKYDITVEHLLTMRMGIEDETHTYFDMYTSDNWLETIIKYPLAFDPGERMRYHTGQTHLLSAIITKISGMSTKEFAERYLTGPMRITLDSWEQDPQGYYFGGNAMSFTPRELAVLGYLYLNGGRIDGTQVVPEVWVDFTLSPSTNLPPNEWGELKNYEYAYLWWLGQINDHDMFMGYGWGGQFVVVFPGLNLIVVSTADWEVDSDTSTIQEWAIFDLVSHYILPAIN